MSLDTIHIANQYPQQGDTLLTKIINLPQQINVNVDAPQLPDSIGATTYMSVKDSTFVDSVYSALRDSIQVFHKSLVQMADTVDSLSAHVTRIFDKGIGFTDDIQIFVIPAFIAVVAFAVPFIFQVASKFDEKYGTKEFRSLFLTDRLTITTGALLLIDLGSIVYYIVTRCFIENFNTPKVIPIVMVLLTIAVFIFMVALLIKALHYNDTIRLFEITINRRKYCPFSKKEYLKALTDQKQNKEDKQQEDDVSLEKMVYIPLSQERARGAHYAFYSSIEHMFQYAIKKDNDLLEELVEYLSQSLKYFQQLHKSCKSDNPTIIYPFEIIESISRIVFDYHKRDDSNLINDRIAYLLYCLYDDTYETGVSDVVLQGLMYSLLQLQQNGHVGAINRFEHLTRHHFANLVRKYIDNERYKGQQQYSDRKSSIYLEDIKNIRYMMILFNARLFDMGQLDCVNDAIENNYDDFGTNTAIMPMDEFDILDVYFNMMNPNTDFHKYASLFSPDGLSWDYTLISKSLTKLMAYLIVRHYKKEYPLKDIPEGILKTNHKEVIEYLKRLHRTASRFEPEIWKNNINTNPDVETIFRELRERLYVLLCQKSQSTVNNDLIRKKYQYILDKKSLSSSLSKILPIVNNKEEGSNKIRVWHINENKLVTICTLAWSINSSNGIPEIKQRLGTLLAQYLNDGIIDKEELSENEIFAYLDGMNADQYEIIYTGLKDLPLKYHIYNFGLVVMTMFPHSVLIIKKEDMPGLYIGNPPTTISYQDIDFTQTLPTEDDELWSLPQIKLTLNPQLWIHYKKGVLIKVLQFI